MFFEVFGKICVVICATDGKCLCVCVIFFRVNQFDFGPENMKINKKRKYRKINFSAC